MTFEEIKNEQDKIKDDDVKIVAEELCISKEDAKEHIKMIIALSDYSYEEIMKYHSLAKLGLEANSKKLDEYYLYNKLKNKKIPIKTALLDQEIIAGLGNIYVDEVCHLCCLHPTTLASNLSIDDCKNIVLASSKTLEKAINEGGTTIRSYTSSLGVTGRFQQHLLVHTKDTCFTCGEKVVKIRVGGRGTYYCPHCQKKTSKVIGITGVISSGKSTVSRYLKSNGYLVVDSDLIVKELYSDTLEMSMLMNVMAATHHIPEESLDKLRGECEEEIRRINGTLSLDTAVKWQS